MTTSELARAAKLPESTVAVVEHEYLMGFITKRAGLPVAGSSSSTQAFGDTYRWVRPLSLEQEVRAMRGMDRGQDLAEVAGDLHVELPAVARLYEEDFPLMAAADDPVMSSPGRASTPVSRTLHEADVAEIRRLASESQLTPAFIAGLLDLSPDEVIRVLQ